MKQKLPLEYSEIPHFKISRDKRYDSYNTLREFNKNGSEGISGNYPP